MFALRGGCSPAQGFLASPRGSPHPRPCPCAQGPALSFQHPDKTPSSSTAWPPTLTWLPSLPTSAPSPHYPQTVRQRGRWVLPTGT